MTIPIDDLLPSDDWQPEERGDEWEHPAPSRNGHIATAACEPEQSQETKPGSYVCELVSPETFAAGDFRPSWLVRRLLVRNQPAILGGPKKGLKTSLLIDLAVSLGTATPFLGEFKVDHVCRVAVLSGESGEHTIQETARRVCRAKDVELAESNVFWGFKLPQLAVPQHLIALGEAIAANDIKVVFLDPLYLSLLANSGEHGLSAANLFDIGPLLSRVARECLDAGATPVLVHHARKNIAAEEPPELEDLAFAGIQEFARQWLLVSRREKYQPGTGQHKLWLSAGGSIGHGGLWALDINEGQIDEDFQGRTWDISITTASDAVASAKAATASEKKAKQQAEHCEQENAVMAALDRLDAQREGLDRKTLLAASGLTERKFDGAAARLMGSLLEMVSVSKKIGNAARISCQGYRRKL